MSAEVAGCLLGVRLGVRSNVPDQGECGVVDLTNLGESDQFVRILSARLNSLPIDPSRSIRIAHDLHVLA